MSELGEKRIAANELLIRDLNQRIAEKIGEFAGGPAEAGDEESDFLCACGRPGCSETVTLTLAEFARAHASENHFAVAPGHEQPELERVVERHERYLVVEKRPGLRPRDVPA